MKKILNIVFVLALIIALFPLSSFAETENPIDVWDGSIAESFASGDGSGRDPFIIESAEQLAYFSKSVNEGTTYEGMRIELNTDIDLNKLEWSPIGTDENPFMGTFMGKSHTVKGLYSVNERDSFGLFGSVKNSNIYNLSIADSYIENAKIVGVFAVKNIKGKFDNCVNYASVVSGEVSGGIVGINDGGLIKKCINYGFIHSETAGGIIGRIPDSGTYGGYVEFCRNVGQIIGKSNAGGIVGQVIGESEIAFCVNGTNVSAFENVGGIVGMNSNGSVTKSRNTADIYAKGEKSHIGGIVGVNGGSVSNCYNTGKIEGNSYVGGIVGSGDGYIRCTYSIGIAIGNDFVGAIAGDAIGKKVENCYYLVGGALNKSGKELFGIGNTEKNEKNTRCYDYETMKKIEAYEGFDYTVWTPDGKIDYNYPEIVSLVSFDNDYINAINKGKLDIPDSVELPNSNNNEPQNEENASSFGIWIVIGVGIILIFGIAFFVSKKKK